MPAEKVSQERSDAVAKMYAGQRSILIIYVAAPGRGKSFSMENLDPSDTHLINVVGKPLPFLSGHEYKEDENMTISDNSSEIVRAMVEADDDPNVRHICVDDAQYVMAMEFMDKAMQKGYDKFTIMARNFWDIIVKSVNLSEGMKVFLLCHEEQSGDYRRMKTLGKLLEEKMTPEGMSAIVLYGEVEVMDGGKRRYYCSTQTDGYTNAKSPHQMFPLEIPNDLDIISKRIDEFYSGVSLADSELDFSIESV